jgi:hypothetical protein
MTFALNKSANVPEEGVRLAVAPRICEETAWRYEQEWQERGRWGEIMRGCILSSKGWS